MVRKNILVGLVVLILTFGKSTTAQEMIGNVFGNYNGIYATVINPSLMTGSKTYLDINLAGGNAFVKNNWGYVPKEGKNIWQLIFGDTLTNQYGEYDYNSDYTYYDNTKSKFFSQTARILGPSVMLQTGKHAYGLSLSTRTVSSGYNISYEIPVLFYEGLSYEKLQGILFNDDDFNFSSAAWAEVALSWAYDFKRSYKGKLSFGATAKFMLAFEGFYAANRNAQYMVLDKSTINFYNYDAEFGFSVPLDYDSITPRYEGPFFKGVGAGIDIGFTYTRLKSSVPPLKESRICSKPYEEYLYRIGISLLDVGSISMGKNAQKHNLDNVSALWTGLDTLGYNGINNFLQEASYQFYGDSTRSKTADKISLGLPTALSLQIEANYLKNLYISALWVQSIQFNSKQLRRPSQIAIAPRFENDYIALSLIGSLLEYRYIRLGAAFRIGPLTIGSERLGILLGITDLDGADIYFSLKFGLNKGRCSLKNKGACFNREFN